VFFLQALFAAVSLFAEAPCPGATASLRYQPVGYLISLPVRIGQSQPYEFLLDTGSQVTIVEPSLAAELGLKSQGPIQVSAFSSEFPAVWTEAETIEVGDLQAQSVHIAVEDLNQIRNLHPSIRGVLGEDFLTQFDFLIDRTHRVVCFDIAHHMQQQIRGDRVMFDLGSGSDFNSPLPHPLLLPVRIDGTDTTTARMLLDSGANVAVLNSSKVTPDWNPDIDIRRGQVVGGKEQYFRRLEPRDIRVGRQSLGPVVFVTPTGDGMQSSNSIQDGLIPAALFRRVFVSYRSGFAILRKL
jgi:hypothetical protein